ncbi:MAG TPA: type IV pilus biogenesis/stability protein PilW [Burkholderiaceae bacterium]|nr:type IV pilus biogenesis/stability protein PilW [Burkholderiaceae bacterium]
MRHRLHHLPLAAALALIGILGGCAAGQGGMGGAGSQAELRTSSDQTEAQKRAHIRMQLAVGYYGQHQLEVALDEIKQALNADPSFADAYNLRGLIYMEMGETRLAEDNLLHALKLQPRNPDLSNNYGWFLCQNGRERAALPYFEAAFANRSYQSPAKALNNAGVCSLKLNDAAAAERYFLQAFQHEPGNAAVNANLAKVYYKQQDDERARFYIDRALKSGQLSAEILWVGIKLERRQGQKSAEASLVTQLRRRFPESMEYASYLRGAFDE